MAIYLPNLFTWLSNLSEFFSVLLLTDLNTFLNVHESLWNQACLPFQILIVKVGFSVVTREIGC